MGWVSLDRSENDPALFWSYVIHALQKVHPGVGESALSMLQTSRQSPTESAPYRYALSLPRACSSATRTRALSRNWSTGPNWMEAVGQALAQAGSMPSFWRS